MCIIIVAPPITAPLPTTVLPHTATSAPMLPPTTALLWGLARSVTPPFQVRPCLLNMPHPPLHGVIGRGPPPPCSWPARNGPMFSNINAMMERCNDLLELVQTIEHFRYTSYTVVYTLCMYSMHVVYMSASLSLNSVNINLE